MKSILFTNKEEPMNEPHILLRSLRKEKRTFKVNVLKKDTIISGNATGSWMWQLSHATMINTKGQLLIALKGYQRNGFDSVSNTLLDFRMQ